MRRNSFVGDSVDFYESSRVDHRFARLKCISQRDYAQTHTDIAKGLCPQNRVNQDATNSSVARWTASRHQESTRIRYTNHVCKTQTGVTKTIPPESGQSSRSSFVSDILCHPRVSIIAKSGRT